MNKHLSIAVLLGAGYLQSGAWSQPQVDPNALESYSIAELERFLGGRTLLSVDVKDASIQEVTAAMSQSSGLKVTPFSVTLGGDTDSAAPRYTFINGRPFFNLKPFAPTTTFTLVAQDKPFWEALRGWNLDARRAAKAAANPASPNSRVSTTQPSEDIQNSFGMNQTADGWQTIPGNWLANGRASSAWPFLIIATTLQRAQVARLSPTGLHELDPPRDPLATTLGELAAPTLASLPATPAPEEKHWSDQLILNAYVLPDPKLDPTDLRCEVTEAIDDKGNDLRLPDGVRINSRDQAYSEFGTGKPLQIALASKPGMGSKLVRLRGVLRFSLVTRTHHWETTDLTTPVQNTLRESGGDFRIGFKGMTHKGNMWDFNFEAESGGKHLEQFWKSWLNGGNVSSFRGIWGLAGINSIKLVDASGRTFQKEGGGTRFRIGRRNTSDTPTPQAISPDLSPMPPDAAENWYYLEEHNQGFRAPTSGLEAGGTVGPPVKLIIDFNIERRQVAVPFEFTNLPLPPS
jgi:hypothetical protein